MDTQALELVDAQRSALLRAVSHDLRTPLATIRAVASDLRDAETLRRRRPATSCSTSLADEAERLDRLVANLLSMSRIDAGVLTPDRQAIALVELFEETVRRHRRLVRDKKVAFDVPLTLPLVDADWTLVDQVLTNLLDNAVRHAPAGSRIDLAARRDGDGWVQVTVTDQGPGIAPSEREAVFTAFRTGAGSALVGHRPRHRPRGRRGPRWHDLGRGRDRRRARRWPSPCRCTVAEPAETDRPIVVVDDEPAILRALTVALRARGYTVDTATDGAGAIDLIATVDPAAVVLDLGLPDLDGIEVCRRVREWSEVPIIVLTADGADDRKVAALDTGADDYVTKPFSTPELLARLRVALRHRTARACRRAGRRGPGGRRRRGRPGPPHGHRRRPAAVAHAQGVRVPRRAGPPPRPGADPPRHPPGGLGRRVRHRDPVPPGLRQPAPQEARRHPRPPPTRHRARRRLPPRRSGSRIEPSSSSCSATRAPGSTRWPRSWCGRWRPTGGPPGCSTTTRSGNLILSLVPTPTHGIPAP